MRFKVHKKPSNVFKMTMALTLLKTSTPVIFRLLLEITVLLQNDCIDFKTYSPLVEPNGKARTPDNKYLC